MKTRKNDLFEYKALDSSLRGNDSGEKALVRLARSMVVREILELCGVASSG